jgi:RimJ/RimL family protein N-acetyltransferase
MPLLETERLLLRPLSADEVDCLYRISNEPNVRLYLWDNEPVSEETIEGFVAQSDRMFSEVKIGVFGIRMRGREVILYLTGGRLHESNSVSGRLRPAYQVPRA